MKKLVRNFNSDELEKAVEVFKITNPLWKREREKYIKTYHFFFLIGCIYVSRIFSEAWIFRWITIENPIELDHSFLGFFEVFLCIVIVCIVNLSCRNFAKAFESF